MKKILLLAILLLFASFTYAQSNVVVINVHYDRGILEIGEHQIQIGNYPDRKVQPDNGFRLDVLSDTEQVLYSFEFLLPIYRFEDSVNFDLSLIGSVQKLSETDFALIVPYFEDSQKIVIYNPDGFEVSSLSLEEFFSPTVKTVLFFSIPIILVLVGLFILLWLKKKKV